MEIERWRKIEHLYHSALEQEENRRAAFVDQACCGDESLRREVESLLAQAQGTESFLEAPALDMAARDLATSLDPGAHSHPAAIGRYRIVRNRPAQGSGRGNAFLRRAEREGNRRGIEGLAGDGTARLEVGKKLAAALAERGTLAWTLSAGGRSSIYIIRR